MGSREIMLWMEGCEIGLWMEGVSGRVGGDGFMRVGIYVWRKDRV